MTAHPGGATLLTVYGGPEMVFQVDDVRGGLQTSCELVSAAGSHSTEHGGMSKALRAAHALESTIRHGSVPSRDARTRSCHTWGAREAGAGNDGGGTR